jgi:hypothetical protein
VAGVFIDPTPYNVYAGDAWSQSFEFGEYTGYTAAVAAGYAGTVAEWLALDPANADTWVAEDLSGLSSWSSQWRPTAESADSLAISLTVDATAAATGVITLGASEAQTRAMGASGVFDIQAALPSVRTLTRAKTKWRLDVTR